MTTRISDEISEWVQGVLTNHPEGGSIKYDVSVTAIPQQQGLVPMTLLTLSIPSVILGQRLTGQSMISSPTPNQAVVEQTVRDLLDNLLNARSQEAKVGSNGQAPGPGDKRLIVP